MHKLIVKLENRKVRLERALRVVRGTVAVTVNRELLSTTVFLKVLGR